MYRIEDGAIQVLLAHPGGPFFVNKDDGVWSIPKGEPDADEGLQGTAQREFEEETGLEPIGPFLPLKPIQQKGGKIAADAKPIRETQSHLRQAGRGWKVRGQHLPLGNQCHCTGFVGSRRRGSSQPDR
jgi:hypothetical protein